MPRWRDDHQFVAMNQHHGKPIVTDWKRHYAEVDRVLDHRLQNLGIVRALNVDRDIGILPFELGKNFRQDMKASALVRSHDDFTARNPLGFRNCREHSFARFNGLFRVLEKKLSRSRQRDFASRAVQQPGANLFFEGTDLRGNGGLRAKTLLRGSGERAQARDFEKGLELVEIHSD